MREQKNYYYTTLLATEEFLDKYLNSGKIINGVKTELIACLFTIQALNYRNIQHTTGLCGRYNNYNPKNSISDIIGATLGYTSLCVLVR